MAIALIAGGLLIGGQAMGVFDRLVIFSPVQGVVLDRGAPVAGAEVLQKATWSDGPDGSAAAHTVTGADGRFVFPAMEKPAGLARLLPHSPMILQLITIRHGGREYVAWKHGKGNYEIDSEAGGKPLNLRCDLANRPEFAGQHYGICRVD